MKSDTQHSVRLLCTPARWLGLCLLVGPALVAQQAPRSAPAPATPAKAVAPPTAKELEAAAKAEKAAARGSASELVELSPFVVNTDKDDGFTAANAGTATRLALDMRDVPAPYTVMTRDFIDAMGITNIQEATTWTTNGGSIVDGNGQDVFNITFLANMRGVALSSGQNRNNYLSAGTLDSYNLERYDFSRGPNAGLFSIGTNTALGGNVGGQTKRARYDRELYTAALTFGSWDYKRATLDYNLPLSERLAVRANAVWYDRGGWRMNEFEKTKGITVSGSYLLTPKTELRLEGVYDVTARNNPQFNLFDNVSGWDGVTVVNGPLLNNQFSSTATPGATYGLTFNGEPQGVNRQAGGYYIWDPSTGTLMNYQNTAFTRRGDETNRTPLLANGVLYSRNGNTAALPFGNGGSTRRPPIMLSTDNGGELDLRYQPLLPNDRFARAINGSNFEVPSKTFTNSVDAPILEQTTKDANFTLTHQIGEKLYFEVGGDVNEVHDRRTNPNNLRNVRIDINRLLPNGATNPHFLDPYMDTPLLWNNRITTNSALRANLAYRDDFGKWGSYTAVLNLGANVRNTKNRNYVYSLGLLPDPRMNQGSDDQIRLRYYWNVADRPYTDSGVPTSAYTVDWTNGNAPVGAMTNIKPRWVIGDWNDQDEKFNFAAFAVKGSYFNGKLVATAVTRYDEFKTKQRARMEFGDLPTNWDGTTLYYKPDAPDNWRDLAFIPRVVTTGVATSTVPIPAATRPRINPLSTPGATTPVTVNGVVVGYTNGTNNGVQIPNPFFANDRFRNDYSNPVNENSGVTGSYGFVYHARPWIDLAANYGTTYVPPPTGAFTLDNDNVDPQTGRGYEYSVRFNVLRDRLSVKVGYFDNVEKHRRVAGLVTSTINSLYSRNRFDDATAEGRNQRGIPDVFGTDYESAKNTGYEVEVTGRLTRSLRISASLGTGEVNVFDQYPLTKTFVPANADPFKQVLEDAGGMLTGGAQSNGAPGLAVANPAITPANLSERDNAVTNYNAIWTLFQTATSNTILPGAKRTTVNVYADYTFQTGKLKGLRVGLGGQYRGDNFIGYRTADTIPNPAYNPALPVSATNPAAIDDPNLGTADRVFVKQPFVATMTLGYTVKLRSGWRRLEGKELVFQLRIKNLLNNQQVVYQDEGVIARPPNGDYTQPNRVSVPVRIGSFTEPTSYLLTTTLKL